MNFAVSDMAAAKKLFVKKACKVFICACGRAEVGIHQKPAVHHESIGVSVGGYILTSGFFDVQVCPESQCIGNSCKYIVACLTAF